MKIESYNLKTSSGKHIRKATKVILDDGRECRFIEKLGSKEAIRQATVKLLTDMAVGECYDPLCQIHNKAAQ